MTTVKSRPPTAGSAPRPIRHPLGRVFSRYTIGSVVAAVVSEITLLLAYGPGPFSPRVASAAAWVTGASANYMLRRWAWGRRGRSHPVREVLPYWAIALVSLGLSTWATGEADRIGNRIFDSPGPRAAFVGAAFLAVYGVLFIAKFLIFHYVLFADRNRPGGAEAGTDGAEPDGSEPDGAPRADDEGQRAGRRSRHQVPSTTRE